MCNLFAALLVACVPAATATGAFGSLWVIDLRRAVEPMWPGYELFTVDHPMSSSYGQNEFAMIASHASQYGFEVYGLWVDDPDAIDDVSDVYVAKNRGHRTIKFIGYVSFLLLIAKLMPMFALGVMPWHETIIHSNDYPGESGCCVTVRSYLQPMVWWLRVGAETSIKAGRMMFYHFKAIKLPRLLVGNEWNYAAWKPYFQNAGPHYFVYMPHKTLDTRDIMVKMAMEESYMAQSNPIHAISKKMIKKIAKAYASVYEEGRWLTKADKAYLSRMRRSEL